MTFVNTAVLASGGRRVPFVAAPGKSAADGRSVSALLLTLFFLPVSLLACVVGVQGRPGEAVPAVLVAAVTAAIPLSIAIVLGRRGLHQARQHGRGVRFPRFVLTLAVVALAAPPVSVLIALVRTQ